jgi:hypothetical protein
MERWLSFQQLRKSDGFQVKNRSFKGKADSAIRKNKLSC